MFKPIENATDGYENITLFDTHDITIHRKGETNNAELVIHPCAIGRLSIRFAKEPYRCNIFLADGNSRQIDLGDESDWGNVQEMTPCGWFKESKDGQTPHDWCDRIGFGNDEEGHTEIVRVELLDGYPNGTEIPLEEFKQDVKDFTIYYEG